jgi:hypothetical protein
VTEASDRMLLLLQELALLKEGDDGEVQVDAAARQKRREEIGQEIKRIAAEKNNNNNKEETPNRM